MNANSHLEFVTRTIIEQIQPSSIYLFGSMAKGNAGPESDIDLMVVWNSHLNAHERNMAIRRLFPNRKFPLDVFTYTPEELNSMKNLNGTVAWEAFHNGKQLYEQK